MKRVLFGIILFLFFFVFFCNPGKTQDYTINKKEILLFYSIVLSVGCPKLDTLIDDRLVSYLFEKFPNISYFKKSFLLSSLSVSPNPYNYKGDVLNDSCFTFFKMLDTVVILVAPSNTILVDATISSEGSIPSLGGIKIGMKKDVFKKITRLDFRGDRVIIGTSEWSSHIIFFFNKDILVRVKFETTYLG